MNHRLHPHSEAALAEAPIGVFDSGLGGLRVLDRLMETLPNERFVYLGDTQHMPYGEKTHEQVCGYVGSALRWLFEEHQVKMMVVACNSASSVAPHLFQGYAPTPFVDPITPICGWLQQEGRYQRVGVMATPATVASNRYQMLLNESGITLTQVPCGNLATLIEAGEGDSPACQALLKTCVAPLIEAQVEAVILGCTHYPYVASLIAELLPEGVEILDPDVFMAMSARRFLQDHGTLAPDSGRERAEVNYFVTADPARFYQTSRQMPFQKVLMTEPQWVALPLMTVADFTK